MKKRIKTFSISMLLIVSMLLTACGSKGDSNGGDASDKASESVASSETSTESTETSENGSRLFPTPQDPLTKSIEYEDAPGVSVMYPELMDAMPHPELPRFILFYPTNLDQSDDVYTNVVVKLEEIEGFDKYMTQGQAMAEQAMQIMIREIVDKTYADAVLSVVGFNFVDGGNYYAITDYVTLDGSMFEPACDEPLSATIEVRYTGPTGYAVVTSTISKDKNIANYYYIAQGITDSVSLNGNWSTAPKVIPTVAQTPKQGVKAPKKAGKKKSSANYKAYSDPGDYGDSFYWEDEDGDIWLWNGFENEFIGFGDTYYVDEDGEIYESNDYGFEDEYYYDCEYDYDYSYLDDYEDPFEAYEYNDYEDGFDDYDDGDSDYYDDSSYDDGGYDDYGGYDDGGYDDYGDDW